MLPFSVILTLWCDITYNIMISLVKVCRLFTMMHLKLADQFLLVLGAKPTFEARPMHEYWCIYSFISMKATINCFMLTSLGKIFIFAKYLFKNKAFNEPENLKLLRPKYKTSLGQSINRLNI